MSVKLQSPFNVIKHLIMCLTAVTLLSHSYFYSSSASTLNLLHLAACRVHCWVNNTVFGWGRYHPKTGGKEKLFVTTSLVRLFMYRNIFMAHCITTQQTECAAGAVHNRDKHTFIRPTMVLHCTGVGWTLGVIRNRRSSLDLSLYLFLYNLTGKTAVLGVGVRNSCLPFASKVFWVSKLRDAADQSQAGELWCLVARQQEGRSRSGTAFGGGCWVGVVSAFSPRSRSCLSQNHLFSFSQRVSVNEEDTNTKLWLLPWANTKYVEDWICMVHTPYTVH